MTALAERLLEREVLFKEDLVELLGERQWESKALEGVQGSANVDAAENEADATDAPAVAGTTDGSGDDAQETPDPDSAVDPDENAA